MMTPTEFKLFAETVEIIAKVLAIVVGGAWAIYGLVVFRQRQAAVTDIQKTQAEVASLDLNSRRRAVLDISIQHSVTVEASSKYVVTLQIVIENTGVAPARLEFADESPPLRVQRVEFDDKGNATYPAAPLTLLVPRALDPSQPSRGRVVRAGGTSRLTSVFRAADAGVYNVSFRVPMDEANRKAMIEAGVPADRKHFWSAMAFGTVGFASPAPAAPAA